MRTVVAARLFHPLDCRISCSEFSVDCQLSCSSVAVWCTQGTVVAEHLCLDCPSINGSGFGPPVASPRVPPGTSFLTAGLSERYKPWRDKHVLLQFRG